MVMIRMIRKETSEFAFSRKLLVSNYNVHGSEISVN